MKLIKISIFLLMMASCCALGFYLMLLQQPLNLPDGVESQRLQINQGQSANALASEFENLGWIPTRYLMKLYVRINPELAKIKTGEYEIKQGMSLIDALKVISEGQGVQYRFTIVEGRNIRELLAEIRNNPNFTQTLPKDNPQDVLMAELGEPDLFPEGLFLPETYHYAKGMKDIEFLKLARSHMKRTLDAAWKNRSDDTAVKTPYEALILASIIEKETAAVHERPLISGVFTNRLRIGMKLQTDPTVIYGIGESYDGDIRFKDLRTDTPYNTYTRYGLPPTPIAMPGKEAIEAALNPQETKALFFVSRNDGTHIFSETLDAHESAVDKYQRNK